MIGLTGGMMLAIIWIMFLMVMCTKNDNKRKCFTAILTTSLILETVIGITLEVILRKG